MLDRNFFKSGSGRKRAAAASSGTKWAGEIVKAGGRGILRKFFKRPKSAMYPLPATIPFVALISEGALAKILIDIHLDYIHTKHSRMGSS